MIGLDKAELELNTDSERQLLMPNCHGQKGLLIPKLLKHDNDYIPDNLSSRLPLPYIATEELDLKIEP